MKPTKLITRRRAIITGLAAAGGLVVTRDWKHLPPTYGNLLRIGDNLTYAAIRALPKPSLVKEYSRADISSFPAINTTDPGTIAGSTLGDAYRRLRGGAFAEWRLSVEGRVATPRTFSLDELNTSRRERKSRDMCARKAGVRSPNGRALR